MSEIEDGSVRGDLADGDFHVHGRQPFEHGVPATGLVGSPVRDRFGRDGDDVKWLPANGLDQLHQVGRASAQLVGHVCDEIHRAPLRLWRGKRHAEPVSVEMRMRSPTYEAAMRSNVVSSWPTVWWKSIQTASR